jgi:hypothetical protein
MQYFKGNLSAQIHEIIPPEKARNICSIAIVTNGNKSVLNNRLNASALHVGRVCQSPV